MAEVVVEFFFDYSSPWTYLCFSRLPHLCRAHGVRIIYRPILVGVVFNSVNPSVYAQRTNPVLAKVGYYNKDMNEWAELAGIALKNPYTTDPNTRLTAPFPVNSARALRGAFHAIQKGKIEEYSNAIFHAYWVDNKDISSAEVVLDCAASVGIDRDEMDKWVSGDESKQLLRDSTAECVARKGFGSPTMFVNKEHMYFGNDRLGLLERRIVRERGGTGHGGVGYIWAASKL